LSETQLKRRVSTRKFAPRGERDAHVHDTRKKGEEHDPAARKEAIISKTKINRILNMKKELVERPTAAEPSTVKEGKIAGQEKVGTSSAKNGTRVS